MKELFRTEITKDKFGEYVGVLKKELANIKSYLHFIESNEILTPEQTFKLGRAMKSSDHIMRGMKEYKTNLVSAIDQNSFDALIEGSSDSYNSTAKRIESIYNSYPAGAQDLRNIFSSWPIFNFINSRSIFYNRLLKLERQRLGAFSSIDAMSEGDFSPTTTSRLITTLDNAVKTQYADSLIDKETKNAANNNDPGIVIDDEASFYKVRVKDFNNIRDVLNSHISSHSNKKDFVDYFADITKKDPIIQIYFEKNLSELL